MIKLIELTLERGPFRVIGAVSGRQGLEVARRVQPDVVLLDLMMPDMDGWEVAQRFRADEALKDVPLIAVSVVHPSSYPARELPVDDYVTKPFRADELVQRVSQAARVVA
jgi:CheY-like chemotaxis protein